jgi:hypothetical protein
MTMRGRGERLEERKEPAQCIHHGCSESAEVPIFELLCCCILSCVNRTAEVISYKSIDMLPCMLTGSNGAFLC